MPAPTQAVAPNTSTSASAPAPAERPGFFRKLSHQKTSQPGTPTDDQPERPGFFKRISHLSDRGSRPGSPSRMHLPKQGAWFPARPDGSSQPSTPKEEVSERPGFFKRVSHLSEKGSAFPSRPVPDGSQPGTLKHEKQKCF